MNVHGGLAGVALSLVAGLWGQSTAVEPVEALAFLWPTWSGWRPCWHYELHHDGERVGCGESMSSRRATEGLVSAVSAASLPLTRVELVFGDPADALESVRAAAAGEMKGDGFAHWLAGQSSVVGVSREPLCLGWVSGSPFSIEAGARVEFTRRMRRPSDDSNEPSWSYIHRNHYLSMVESKVVERVNKGVDVAHGEDTTVVSAVRRNSDGTLEMRPGVYVSPAGPRPLGIEDLPLLPPRRKESRAGTTMRNTLHVDKMQAMADRLKMSRMPRLPLDSTRIPSVDQIKKHVAGMKEFGLALGKITRAMLGISIFDVAAALRRSKRGRMFLAKTRLSNALGREPSDSEVAHMSKAQCRLRRSRQNRSDRPRGAARVQSRVTGEPIRLVEERKPGVRLGSTRGVTVKISDSIEFANGVRVNTKSLRKVRGAGAWVT